MARGEAANAARPRPITALHPAWPMRQRGLTPYLSRLASVPNIKGAAPSGRRLPPTLYRSLYHLSLFFRLYQRSLILIQNDPLNMISGSGIDGMCNIPILSV